MKNNQLNKSLFLLSTCLILAAFYFHNGYFKLVNEVIFSDAAIPLEYQQDKLYFMAEKLKWKQYSIYSLWLISLILLVYNWLIPNPDKLIRAIIYIQFICCFIALIFWIIIPKGMISF